MTSRIGKEIESLEKVVYYSIVVAFIIDFTLETLFGIEGVEKIVIRFAFFFLILFLLFRILYSVIFRPFLIKISHFPKLPLISYDHERYYYVNHPFLPLVQKNGTIKECPGFLSYSIKIEKKWYVKVKTIKIRTKVEKFLGSGNARIRTSKITFPREMKYETSEEGYHEFSHSELPDSQWDFLFRHEIDRESLESASSRFFLSLM